MQLYIAGNFKVGKSNWSGKIYFKDFTDLDFFYTCIFFIFSYAKRMLHSEQPAVLLAQKDLITMLMTKFENLNFILNILRATQDLLVLQTH